MSDDLKILPTRTGPAIGHASERTMADKVNSEGIRTVIRDNLDGTQTRLKTRAGALEYVTTGGVSKEDETPECGWSYDFYPVKKVDGVMVADTVTFDGYSYPNMNYVAGAKTRRYGLKKISGAPALKAMPSHYDGVDEEDRTKLSGPYYWYTKKHVVTWTRYTYVPGDKYPYPSYVSLGVIRIGKKQITVIAPSGDIVDNTKILIAACVAKSPSGVLYVRAAVAASEDGTGNGTRRIEVWDYPPSGGNVKKTIVATGVNVSPTVAAAWSPDGKSLMVGENEALRLATVFSVSRPDSSGAEVEVSSVMYVGDVVKPSAPADYSHTAVLPVDPVTSYTGSLAFIHNASTVSYDRIYEESVNQVTGEVVVGYDSPVLPRQIRIRDGEGLTILDEIGGTADRWVSSVGFSQSGVPCAVVHTELVSSQYRKETRVWHNSDDVYATLYTTEQFSTSYPWVTRTVYATCLQRTTLSRNSTIVNENRATSVTRTVNYLVGGVTAWSKSQTLTLSESAQETSSSESKSVTDADPITSIWTGTSTSTTSNTTSGYAERGFITLDAVVSDFYKDKIAVFWHEPLKSTPKTTSSSSSVVTGSTGTYDTASLTQLTSTPINTNTSTSEQSPDFQKPEIIPASITRLQLSQTKDQVTSFQFDWNNYGLSGYRSYFAGSAAWCPYGDAWLFVSRWPTSDYVGYLCKKNEWKRMVLNPNEPVAVYNGKTPWFAFTNLCPFR